MKTIRTWTLILMVLLFHSRQLSAQIAVRLTGTIYGNDHQPLAGATITVEPSGKITITDSMGRYNLALSPGKTYDISITHVNHSKLSERITLKATTIKDWTLTENRQQLQEVKVSALSPASKLASQPIKAQVISTAASKEQPSTLIELMNRSAGIRIRQSGGLGSNSNLMLNGFQNRAVKYFKDGIPLDYLGAGFDISLVPVNMLDHVEVYKGVLPAYLGADALGGAVNLVTKTNHKNFAELSYEAGSFNTHRVSLNSGWKSKNEKYFAGVNGFFNYSDNNYGVDVMVADTATGISKPVHTNLFHSKFLNYYAEAFAGIANTKWADEFSITLTTFSIHKQFQFGSTMDKPFGAANGIQRSFAPSLRYRKRFFNNRLDISQFLVKNKLNVQTIDTLHGQYNWYGQFIPNPTATGELSNSGTLSDVDFKYLTSRTNLSYKFSESQSLGLNVVFSNYTREGNDPLGHKFTNGIDVLTTPAKYNKVIVAADLSSTIIPGKLQNNLVGKFYHYNTDASDGDYRGNEVHTKNNNTQWGVADGLKFTINTKSFATLSAETALRLPEQDELFGDGNLKLSNFALKPERSFNLNAGYRIAASNKYAFEVNAFYRYTKDLILLMPYNFMYAQSQNVNKVKGQGINLDGNYFLFRWLNINANVTYQNLRLAQTGYSTTEGARLKNTPYFFANMGANMRWEHVLGKQDKLNVYWYYSFVREYYLDYIPKQVEPSGFLGLFGRAKIDAKNIIPDQSTHTAGFTYYPIAAPLSIGCQVKNIFNANVYDNFRIQNPGRGIYVKVSYSL